MLQLFRTFQVAGIFILVGFAAILRAVAFAIGIPSQLEGVLNPWALWLETFWVGGGIDDWTLGALCVAILGFGASFSLQHYRLADAGMLPGFVAVVLGSASWVWLGFSPLLFGAILIAYAVHRLYECYRHQGISLPVFDAGLLIGCAWLIAPGFLWFLPAAIIGLAQLRGFRFSDFFGMLVGAAIPAVLVGGYHFLTDSLDSFLWIEGIDQWKLTESLFELPDVSAIAQNWPWFSIVAVSSLLAFAGIDQLTNRRPIQEQRYNRLIYNFLGAGWLAILFSGSVHPWSFAFVLFPLSLLLGIWLSELSRKRADTVSMVVLLFVMAGFLWAALT
ncbi:MAG: hypothetical protein AB8F78_08045 [Saprospiraceae bacterium]